MTTNIKIYIPPIHPHHRITMALTLDDSIRLMNVRALKADVPLDEEQIEWVKQAYQKIESYKGQKIKVRNIDEALSQVGNSEKIRNQDYLDGQFGGQLLSLRVVNLSESNRNAVAEYEEKQKTAPPGASYWRPVVGNKRLFLVADNRRSNLYLGIASPTEIDGGGTFLPIRIAKMAYRK